MKLNGANGATTIELTEREKEVLHWAAKGKTAWEIGKILNLSHRTVEWHTQRLMKKLGAPNRTKAVVKAIRAGIIVQVWVGSSLIFTDELLEQLQFMLDFSAYL